MHHSARSACLRSQLSGAAVQLAKHTHSNGGGNAWAGNTDDESYDQMDGWAEIDGSSSD